MARPCSCKTTSALGLGAHSRAFSASVYRLHVHDNLEPCRYYGSPSYLCEQCPVCSSPRVFRGSVQKRKRARPNENLLAAVPSLFSWPCSRGLGRTPGPRVSTSAVRSGVANATAARTERGSEGARERPSNGVGDSLVRPLRSARKIAILSTQMGTKYLYYTPPGRRLRRPLPPCEGTTRKRWTMFQRSNARIAHGSRLDFQERPRPSWPPT